MIEYQYTTAQDLLSPIGLNLNGKYIKFDDLPESVKTLISNPKYVVLVRESTTTQTAGGGRTSGTMWYNKQVLGFTVEDAIRDKKISDKTAIPDVIEDPSKFNGIPSNTYNIILSPVTSKEGIRASFYDGKGMRVSSLNDPSGNIVYEKDVFVSANFATDRGNIAFSGVFIHGGASENYSSGCIIFSNKRNEDKTILDNDKAVIALNKYLQSIKLIGSGKTQQFVIVNLWELPKPSPIISSSATIIDGGTTQPIQGVQTEIIIPPKTP